MKNFAKLIIIFAILVFSNFYVVNRDIHAQTLDDLYDELALLEQEVEDAKTSIDDTNASIQANEEAIAAATETIATKQEEIDTNQAEIYVLEEEKEQKDEDIRDLLIYYQTNNTTNEELSFVVNADSLTDSIHRENVVDSLTSKSSDKINEFIAIQESLTTKNEELATDIEELYTLQDNLTNQIAEYELTIDDLNKYQVGAAEKVTDLKNTIAYYEGLGCGASEDLEACKERNKAVVPNASGFVSPMEDGYITSNFGWRWGRIHAGIDMSGSSTAIFAAAPGIVGAVGFDKSRGNYVYVHHTINGARYSTAYFHMSSSAYVSVGDNVDVNTQLGNMGNTGNSSGPHLHFEILVDWYGLTGYNSSLARNPRNFLSYPAVMVYWSGRNR